jgi:hypothetical protein
MNKVATIASRSSVYEAPFIDWNNDTYTPVANKTIMDLIDDKISSLNLKVKNEEYRVSKSNDGLI